MSSGVTESATLVVAWNVGKTTQARQVKAAGTVLAHLKEAASRVDRIIEEGEGKAYDPDDEQEDAAYLTVDRADLLDPNLERELLKGPSLPLISADELRKRRLLGYGLVLGDDPSERRLYIKKRSPVQMLSKSLVTRFNQTLSRIEDPVLAFETLYDVKLDGENVWALHQANFEGLFKESEAVLAMAGDWVNDLAKHVPMKKQALADLTEMVERNSVLRRKLQSVLRRPHVASLTSTTLKQAMKDHGLDPTKIMPRGKLVVNHKNATLLLELLNEDLWEGYFSSEKWSARHKARR